MNAIARKQYMIKKLQTEGSINITEIAEELSVSTMTIRRDLNALSENGLVTLEHGGAVLNQGSLFEYDMTFKQEEKTEEKIRIAQKCLEYISEGDSIYLDAGTTANRIATLLEAKKNIIVLTHSLLAANSLARIKNINMIMCPGEFRQVSMAYMGPLTDEFVSRFQIDTFFLGVEGIDVNGVSVPDITDGVTKKALIRKAKRVICAADSSKFTKNYLYTIADLSEIDLIITDSGLSDELYNEYTQRNFNIIRV